MVGIILYDNAQCMHLYIINIYTELLLDVGTIT